MSHFHLHLQLIFDLSNLADVLLLLESSSSMCCILFSALFSDDLATALWSGEVRCSGMTGFVHCMGDDVVWHRKVVGWVGGLLNIQSVF